MWLHRHRPSTGYWLAPQTFAYLSNHKVGGLSVLPGIAMCEMAMAAGVDVFRSRSVSVRNIEFPLALSLRQGDLETRQTLDAEHWFTLSSKQGTHAQFRVTLDCWCKPGRWNTAIAT